jgi:hypothetical protein
MSEEEVYSETVVIPRTPILTDEEIYGEAINEIIDRKERKRITPSSHRKVEVQFRNVEYYPCCSRVKRICLDGGRLKDAGCLFLLLAMFIIGFSVGFISGIFFDSSFKK